MGESIIASVFLLKKNIYKVLSLSAQELIFSCIGHVEEGAIEGSC